jgi:subtilisin family serine protease
VPVRRRLCLALASLIIALWAASAAQSANLVLRLAPTASAGRASQLADLVGGRVVGSLPQIDAYLIGVPDRSGPIGPLLDLLQRQAGVRGAAAPRELRLLDTGPLAADDPLQGSQWHLGKISAPAAWTVTQGSDGVVIAIVDTGVDYNHPDLAANIWTNPGEIAGNGIDDDHNGFIDDIHGWDFVNGDADPRSGGKTVSISEAIVYRAAD